MSFANALIYPELKDYFSGRDNNLWLKGTLLFWDQLYTLEPDGCNNPYDDPVSSYLSDQGILKPIYLNPKSPEVVEASKLAVRRISELNEEFYYGEDAYIPSKSVTVDFYDTLDMIADIEAIRDGYISLPHTLDVYYKSILAKSVSESHGVSLLTYKNSFDHFVDKIRQDTPDTSSFHYSAEAVLLTMLLKNIRIVDENTTIEDILIFRKRYGAELGRFRSAIGKLTDNIKYSQFEPGYEQEIYKIYANEVMPAYDDLTRALNGYRIKWVADNFLKISTLTASSTALPLVIGLNIPQALALTGGLSVVATLINVNLEFQKEIRKSPYSYLYLANRRL